MVTKVRDIMTAQQAADYLQVHVKTVYEWIRSARLKALKLGPRSVRIRKVDIDQFLDTRVLDATEFRPPAMEDPIEAIAINSAEIPTRRVNAEKLKATR